MTEAQLREIKRLFDDMPRGTPGREEGITLFFELDRTQRELGEVKRERENKDNELQFCKNSLLSRDADVEEIVDAIKSWENRHTHENPAVADLANILSRWL
jgi:hypothetical protein